jgi:hypothetical protein
MIIRKPLTVKDLMETLETAKFRWWQQLHFRNL